MQFVVDLTELQHNSVKVAGGFGPIRYEPSQLTWLQRPTAQGIEVASRNFAEAMLSDQLNSAIASLVAAIENQASATNDVSGSAGLTYNAMNDAHALFGDASQMLETQVMTGSTAHKLLGQALDNGAQLFSEGTVRVIDILGKRSVITDSPALTAGTNKERVLALSQMAAVIASNNDFRSAIVEGTGKTRLETTYQAEYTENVSVKGYSWNTAVKSPVKAALETGTNWSLVMPLKESAGVMLIGDSTKGNA